jgi:hypothetical protein
MVERRNLSSGTLDGPLWVVTPFVTLAERLALATFALSTFFLWAPVLDEALDQPIVIPDDCDGEAPLLSR